MTPALRLGLWLVPALVSAPLAYWQGERRATERCQTRLAQQQDSQRRQETQRAQETARRWQAALRQEQTLRRQLEQREGALLRQQRQLADRQQQLRQRMDHALQQDSRAFTGLGPDSLRLYRQFLGYPADALPASQPLSAGNAGQAPSPATGLPPADLLAHAADYGAWCQQLEQRLSALFALYSPQGEHHD
ncbi:hypothetical protein CEK28_13990 [Xenophilus sp. AP218F]|nr:hypothetical protein CEK28_13990 [Xenophilus sp. AP218F]